MKTPQQYYDEFLKKREGNHGGIQGHKTSILEVIKQVQLDAQKDMVTEETVCHNNLPDWAPYPDVDMKQCPWCTDPACDGTCIDTVAI